MSHVQGLARQAELLGLPLGRLFSREEQDPIRTPARRFQLQHGKEWQVAAQSPAGGSTLGLGGAERFGQADGEDVPRVWKVTGDSSHDHQTWAPKGTGAQRRMAPCPQTSSWHVGRLPGPGSPSPCDACPPAALPPPCSPLSASFSPASAEGCHLASKEPPQTGEEAGKKV